MRVIVATNNAGKLAELRRLLPEDVQLITLDEAGLPQPEETGLTFTENALIKARAAARRVDAAIADDSGLEVEALGGQPGVRSARYAGQGANDANNNQKLLSNLVGVPVDRRRARFMSAVALVTNDGREYVATGSVDGLILDQPRGHRGFGYDPLFEIHDRDAGTMNGRAMAELTVEEKNEISHRGRAYRALLDLLRQSGFFVAQAKGSAR